MRKIWFVCIFLATNIVGAQAGLETTMQSVVSVLPVWETGTRNLQEPEGSGIVIGNGSQILTTAHVVKTARSIRVRTTDGLIVRAKLLWKDTASDVALLEIPKILKPVKLYSSGHVGEPACAIGNAFGLGVSVSCGVISATQKTNAGFNAVEDFIQTDAGMNPGKSGGALVNGDGQVIGMLSAIFTKKSDANIGVNFAVSARLLKQLLKQRAQSPDASWRKSSMGLALYPAGRKTGFSGAMVVRIGSNSEVETFGLLKGDVIIQAGARRIKTPEDFATEFAVFERKNMPIIVMRRDVKTKLVWQFKTKKESENE